MPDFASTILIVFVVTMGNVLEMRPVVAAAARELPGRRREWVGGKCDPRWACFSKKKVKWCIWRAGVEPGPLV